ncbi:LCCL domain-containing protein [Anatilimnocola floriformis]|uniref:LCCL domain-containing protein n=1 Tax=Anatilimnocola floriformis TaxID=2948575 RepID=UPI0020C3FB30|nr:LCCL domain-containing protein [Anatilimnocola floriformis]
MIRLSVALLLLLPLVAAAQNSNTEKKPTIDPRTISVVLTDGSSMKVLLAEETIELQTPHGKLTFPIADIVKIEFAYRAAEEVSLAIEKMIDDLGSTDFKVREVAMAGLLEKKEKCYAALVRAVRQQSDLEMRQRLEQLIERLKQDIPEERLNVRTQDYIYTADSKIAGKLAVKQFKISSAQFGKLELKLSDIQDLKLASAAPELPDDDLKNVQQDPGNMQAYTGQIGKSFAFRVTGNGSYCYGTDVYTTDSPLATAAVHMGLLKQGETGVLICTMLASPPSFTSSTRNGITSSNWSQYPAAYTLRKPRTSQPR